MSAEKLKQLSKDELRVREHELRETLARLHMKRHARRLEKPSEMHVAKKDLARVLTALNAGTARDRGAK